MTATFDTLSAARSLEAAGIESKQAEAIVGAIRASGEASVTKTDLLASTNELRGEMKAMAAEAARRDQLRREQDAACPTRHRWVAVCCATDLWVGGLRIARHGPRHPNPHLREAQNAVRGILCQFFGRPGCNGGALALSPTILAGQAEGRVPQ